MYVEMDEEENKKQEEDDKAFKAFQGKGVSISTSSLPKELEEYFDMTDPAKDPELAFAITMSISEKFTVKLPEDESNLSLNIRFPDGSLKSWTFPLSATVEDLYDFVKVNLPEGQYTRFKIAISYPRQQITALKNYLIETGISNKESLIVDKI